MKSISVKLAGAFAAVAFAVTASSASALTTQELIDLLVGAGLLTADQVSAVVGTAGGSSTGSSAACGPFTRDLTIGATGSDVTTLQNFLMGAGQSIPAGATGYFGSQTQAALSGWQAANMVSPAAGYFGPITKAKVATMCAPSTGTGSTGTGSSSSSLSGGAGAVDSYTLMTTYNNENVGEGEDDVPVLGIEVENSDDSDIKILAVKVNFANISSATSSEDLEDFASDVTIWLDDEEVAKIDADEFNDDNSFSKTISLDSSAIIDAGDTADLVVALSGNNVIDSADTADTANDWQADVTSVRWTDAQGTVVSEDPGTAVRAFEFETFADSTNVEVTFKEGDKDTNDAHILDVDENDETTHDVLSFIVKVKGDDVTMKDVDVEFDTVGFNIDDGVSEFILMYDGDEVGSETPTSATTNEVVTFDDLDLDLEIGEHEFTAVAVLNSSSTAAFVDGDTIAANIGASERNGSDLEDSNGDNLATGDRKGTVTGEALALFDSAIALTWVNDSGSSEVTVDSTNNDYVKLVLNFEVENLSDDTLYIPDVVTLTGSSTSETRTAPSTSQGVGYSIQHSGLNMAYFPASSTSAVLSSSADKETNSYEVLSGQSETFKVTITSANSTGALNDLGTVNLKALLSGVGWADTDSATSDSVYTYDLTNFETDGFYYIAD